MAQKHRRSNREAKKPKQNKKVVAANPSFVTMPGNAAKSGASSKRK
jgi:hypothetical protein